MRERPDDPDFLFGLSATLQHLADAVERAGAVAGPGAGPARIGAFAMDLAEDLHECALFDIVPGERRLEEADRVRRTLEAALDLRASDEPRVHPPLQDR